MPSPTKEISAAKAAAHRQAFAIMLGCLFLGMSTRGLILPALPPFIIDTLGEDVATVGLVMAAQSIASLISRPWAGRLTDRHGGRTTLSVGLALISLAALAYLLALAPFLEHRFGLGILVIARILTGVGEGLVVTGGGAWAIALSGLDRAASAMTWVGLALFGGIIIGAAGGARLTFPIASCLVLVIAAIGWWGVRQARDEMVTRERLPVAFPQVLRAVWWPGVTLGLAAAGLAAVSSYVVLLFATHGWADGGLAIAFFSVGAVSARLILGRYADRLAGYPAVMASLCVEACGLMMVGAAASPFAANIGTTIAGFGFSMVYPWMALPALRGIPAEGRGSVIGLYDASFDIATALAVAGSGFLAGHYGVQIVFYVAAAAVFLANVGVLAASRTRPDR